MQNAEPVKAFYRSDRKAEEATVSDPGPKNNGNHNKRNTSFINTLFEMYYIYSNHTLLMNLIYVCISAKSKLGPYWLPAFGQSSSQAATSCSQIELPTTNMQIVTMNVALSLQAGLETQSILCA